jgi:poly-gamma-glutamate capsule biosynthesis protein CapA/YwtB (metallophosphatase superfamily)
VHAGTEYNTDQVTAAHTLLASPDIDLVYGHHAHVVQPLQKIDGKWVIYGLGNNIAAQETPVEGTPPRPARPGLRDLGAHRTRPRRHRG